MKSALKIVPGRTPDTRPLLEVDGLTKSFVTNGGRAAVLNDVSFNVRRGEIVCVLGRSGCGKTTLLKLLAGFLPPDHGTINLAGDPVTKPGPERGVIFQEDALFPWLTVRENIAFGLRGRGQRGKTATGEVERFLELVGLAGFGDYLPIEISGGMKQRVALARVLIMHPELLLLDEPFSALDTQTREEMQDLLLMLSRQLSHSVLFITHDVEEAVLLADRIILFDPACHGICREIAVDLGRPRARRESGFSALTREIVGLLKGHGNTTLSGRAIPKLFCGRSKSHSFSRPRD
ncbi:MAG: ABC transporter ATP-binding protein [Desulfuromonas sp.]|nr:MAG: ABC transporter ATP-binding protein [Desulfuromonas sp.]